MRTLQLIQFLALGLMWSCEGVADANPPSTPSRISPEYIYRVMQSMASLAISRHCCYDISMNASNITSNREAQGLQCSIDASVLDGVWDNGIDSMGYRHYLFIQSVCSNEYIVIYFEDSDTDQCIVFRSGWVFDGILRLDHPIGLRKKPYTDLVIIAAGALRKLVPWPVAERWDLEKVVEKSHELPKYGFHNGYFEKTDDVEVSGSSRDR